MLVQCFHEALDAKRFNGETDNGVGVFTKANTPSLKGGERVDFGQFIHGTWHVSYMVSGFSQKLCPRQSNVEMSTKIDASQSRHHISYSYIRHTSRPRFSRYGLLPIHTSRTSHSI